MATPKKVGIRKKWFGNNKIIPRRWVLGENNLIITSKLYKKTIFFTSQEGGYYEKSSNIYIKIVLKEIDFSTPKRVDITKKNHWIISKLSKC